ncbi:MAG: XRE family transcriptional regulator, partial [Lachnospiraceae bacterium]|nr:XRE family transcriptional regulator [Lachnospiraceae bacterium]
FQVSVDYLIKEEVEVVEHITETEVMDTSVRRVSLEEANEFLRIKKEEAPRVAFGVSLCILSPICMFLLGAAGELNMIPLSENAAGAIGMMILLVIVAFACAIFIPSGMKTKPYEFLEKEIIETEYGVTGMVKERKQKYQDTYVKYNIMGTVICLLAGMALFGAAFVEGKEFLEVVFLCISLVIAAIGVRFLVLAGIMQGGFQRLLQEGDYSIEEKTNARSSVVGAVSAIYWLVVTAIFLCLCFTGKAYNTCGLIWPIAGVLFPVVVIVIKLFEKK